MLTRYGTDVLIGIAIIVAILISLGIWIETGWLRWTLIAIALFLTVFSLNFFRDPDRSIPNDSDLASSVISPADGVVVLIKETDENEYRKERSKLISIFMSPLDVHVNRIPVSGTVEYLKYIPGKFLVASDDAAASENERQNIGIASNSRKLMFSQVTGFVARRIVCELQTGQMVNSGERFGMIKFGSRVDVYLPLSAEVLVKNGDRTVAGETIIARW